MADRMLDLFRQSLSGQLRQLRDGVRELSTPLSEEEFWKKPLSPGNSIGHLVLHLTGNLNHFVGAQLGGTGYVRDREREFAESAPPSKSIALARLDEAVGTFERTISVLTEEQLARPHPDSRFGTVFNALISIVNHFALHRGQMSYLQRLVAPGAKA
jgi:uncharacterized damage-inducible protein DinB